jgi:hypothetical protein
MAKQVAERVVGLPRYHPTCRLVSGFCLVVRFCNLPGLLQPLREVVVGLVEHGMHTSEGKCGSHFDLLHARLLPPDH